MITALLWLASAYGEYAVGIAAAAAASKLLGRPVDEAQRATDAALDHARAAFHERYGDTYGPSGSTFLERGSNERLFLRSTFPSQDRVAVSDLDLRGFGNAETASEEAAAFALEAFENALVDTPSRDLDRDRTQQATLRAAERGAEASESVLDQLLSNDEVGGALRESLERQAPSVETLVEQGQLQEATSLLRARIDDTLTLADTPGPVLRDLLDRHVQALRIELGNVLAQAADTVGARKQLDAVGEMSTLPDDQAFGGARLAYNVRDVEALGALRARFTAGSSERNQADVWHAVASEAWEQVLVGLDAFEDEDAANIQTRARALIELRRGYAEAAGHLDAAWSEAVKPHLRLAVAVATADLMEVVVDEEAEAVGLDREALVRSATHRLGTAVGDATAPFLHAHAHLRTSRWFGFLDDRERHDAAVESFEALGLTPDERLRFVIDPDIDGPTLQQHVQDGVVDLAVRDWVRAQQFQAQQNPRREEAALWDALDADPEGHLRDVIAERLIDIQIEAEDRAGAEAALHALPEDESLHPLFAAKIVGAFQGDPAARAALAEVLDGRPRCRPALRSLFFLTAKAAAEAEGGTRAGLVREAEDYADRLYTLLPSRTPRLMIAGLYARVGRLNDAISIYDELVVAGEPTVYLLTTKSDLLVRAERLPEAAEALEAAYTLDPMNARLGSEAGRLWAEATQFEKAASVLERVALDHPEEPVPSANLGFARLRSSDPGQRADALAAFETALGLEADLGISPFTLLEAANAADDPVAARRYSQLMQAEAKHLDVSTPEDVEKMERLASEDGAVQGRFADKDAIRAFVEHQSRRAEAFGTLASSDMAPFGSIARRPWSSWLSATRGFARNDVARFPNAYVARAPWPSEVMLRPFGRDDPRHPIGPSEGLFVDLTALLTLASIGALDEGLRSVQGTYGRVVLYPGALADLRDEISSVAGGLAWQDRQPYAPVIALLDRHDVGPRPSDPSAADLASLVTNAAAEALGNAAPDVGLALHLDADYVSQPTTFDTEEERTWGGRTWTSAEVLHALRRENRIGQTQATEIAAAASRTFEGWADTDPPPLRDLVVSGFVLTDWFTSGLLDLWIQHRAEWPALRVGPFGIGHLRAQIDERAERQALVDAMRAALTTLDELTAQGVVEALPEDAEWEEDPDDDVPLVWQHAVHLFEVAAERDLHVWADDRALGFLLWQYDTPVTGPVLDPAAQAIRERFDATSLVSTEMVLETFTDLPVERAAELGWALFETGYRPLLGRLALRHLLAEYGHDFDGPPYDRLFAALGALSSFLPPEHIVLPPRREAYLNIAAVPVLDALLDVAWNDPGLDGSEREALGDAILGACWGLFDGASPSAAGLSFARLLLSMGWYREQRGGDEPDAEAWLGNALAQRLPPSRQQAVARAVEDMAIQMYRGLRSLTDDGDEAVDERTRTEVANRLSAQIAWQRLVPLFASDLLQTHAPAFRRLLAMLAGSPASGQATRTLRRGLPIPLSVDEEEMERAAIGAFWSARDHAEHRELLGLTRVHGGWKRPTPEADRAADPTLPATHPVEIDVPYLTLALRDDDELRAAVIAYLAHGLDLVDPDLRERVRELTPDLSSDDEGERAHAVERLADAIMGSTALDLERDLAHATDRLRQRSLDDLEAWLYNPERPPDDADRPDVVDPGEGRRVPSGALVAGLLLSFRPSYVGGGPAAAAATTLEMVEGGDVTLDGAVTTVAEGAATAPSGFSAVYQFLTLMFMALDAPAATVTRGSAPVPVREWAQQYVLDLVRNDRTAPAIRHPYLTDAHAYVLRLALHACSAPRVLAQMHERAENDDEKLAREWTTSILVSSERLGAFAADRYPDPYETAFHLQQACERVGFVLDQPGKTFDRLNPMLFGPGLVHHERWVFLHALEVSWEMLLDGETPIWWSDDVRDALEHLAEHPEPHEDLLVDTEVQNGLAITLDRPPSQLARALLDRLKAGDSQNTAVHDGGPDLDA